VAIATGDLVESASGGHAYNYFWYIGYQNQYYPANLTPDQLAIKWQTVYAYDRVMKALMGETIIGTSDAEVWVPDQLRSAVSKPHRYRVDDAVRARAREVLPFKLTAAQKRVLGELAADLQRPQPMRRLLQGDVGSGKTVIAAMLLLIAAESRLQAAFLAPTELLAEQHFTTLSRLLGRQAVGASAHRVRTLGGQVKVDDAAPIGHPAHAAPPPTSRVARPRE